MYMRVKFKNDEERKTRRKQLLHYNYMARRLTEPEHFKRWNEKIKKRNREIRMTVLRYYSNSEIPFCACCKEDTFEFLALDHINNDGREFGRRYPGTRSGNGTTYWALNNNFPPIFRVLCHNCNMAASNYGACPHTKNGD